MGSQPIRIQLRKILWEILVGNAAGNAVANLVGKLAENLAEKVLMVCNRSNDGKKPPT